ncbi:family 78 glycoside hydrolase catalytic domain [Rhodopirellula sallentina]|nr:family 78 glycoside hydrolase catalytic domain [Rhodopirellula sallentina]
MKRFLSIGCAFLVAMLLTTVSSGEEAWRQYVGKAGPSGWRCHVIQPDAKDDGPDGINFHDWNGDGYVDVFVNYEEGRYSRLYFNPGSNKCRGLWDDWIEFHHGPCEDSSIGDLDNDGDIDFIANGGWVYFNPGQTHVRDVNRWGKMTLFDHEQRVPLVMDVNQDGLNDLIVGAQTWFKQPADGKHDANNWPKHILGSAEWPMNCIPHDVNGDTEVDLVVPNRRKEVFWYENPGRERVTMRWPRKPLHPHKSMFVALGDVNGDGTTDVAIAGGKEGTEQWSHKLTVLLRTNRSGDPQYHEIVIDQPCGNFPKGVAIVDLDNDPTTKEIVVTPKQGDLWMAIYEGDPMDAKNWTTKVIQTPGSETRKKMDNVYLADIDGDGDQDIATTEENGGWGVIWFENPSRVCTEIKATALKCEYLTDPRGIDIPDPRFFWQVKSDQDDAVQSAYQLIVATSEALIAENNGDVFDSGKVVSDRSIQIAYEGKPLSSATDYYWKVRIWGRDDQPSAWSGTARFATGLLNDGDWKNSQWIAWKDHDAWQNAWWKRKEVELKCQEFYLPSYFGARMNMFERMYFHGENRYDPAPLLRKTFATKKPIASAKVFICGLGYHELFLNGSRVSDHVLDPGWTQYNRTALYVAHDVTDFVRDGENAIGVMLGRGNYGMLALDHWGFYKKGGYIGQPKLKCLIKIDYEDGTTQNVVSDLSWKVTGGPIQYDCPHMGEVYDATKEIPGWNTPEFDDAGWDSVHSAPAPEGELKSQLCEPIRVVKTFRPVSVKPGGRGSFLVDAGTNLAGWLRVKIDAPAGTPITIYYGEDSDPLTHGQPGGYQQNAYVAKGEPGEVAECHFSYKGFRYALIKGHDKSLTADDVEVCQVNSDVTDVSTFQTSDAMINQLHMICRRSLTSNLHSIPTDCPHREKNGWMGDATTGMEYGMANYDLAALMTKFVGDMLDTQDDEGRMAAIAPCNSNARKRGRSPLWSAACVHVSWYMYQTYGDTRIFERDWDRLSLFTEGVWKHNGVPGQRGIFKDGYGDWTSPHGNKGEEGVEVYSTMNFFLVLQRMAHMAKILGKAEDAIKFNSQAEEVRQALYTHCFDAEQTIFTGTKPSGYRQGPNAMALYCRIAKPEHCDAVLKRLIQDIKVDRDLHVYGGIFTGQAAWEVMPQSGHAELAHDVLSTDTFPGYGKMLANDATTVWEHWTGGGSRIHHFLGYVDNYLTRYVAGIRCDLTKPGFKNILFEPQFINQVDDAEYHFDSIHGPTSIRWQRTGDDKYAIELIIPANCTGEFVVAAESVKSIMLNGDAHDLDGYQLHPLNRTAVVQKKQSLRLPSGNHQILLITSSAAP